MDTPSTTTEEKGHSSAELEAEARRLAWVAGFGKFIAQQQANIDKKLLERLRAEKRRQLFAR